MLDCCVLDFAGVAHPLQVLHEELLFQYLIEDGKPVEGELLAEEGLQSLYIVVVRPTDPDILVF